MKNFMKKDAPPQQEATREPLNIKELGTDELKAMCYDQIVLLNQTQQNINVLQAEITTREQSK